MRFTTLLLLLLINTWCINTYHIGVMIPPTLHPSDLKGPPGRWYDKKVMGIHQIILEGGDFHRGYEFGRLTKKFLILQENELVKQLNTFFPIPILQQAFFLSLIRWFWGIEKYFEPSFLKEMLGVGLHTSQDFNYLGDPFTRQIAYHGLHEVGQMMIGYKNSSEESQGCTVFGIKTPHSWLIGRNFDFEAGKIFDEHKIMKWSFPPQGHSYLSIIWAGMVGAVTGVNDAGVYISINAAGSADFSRYGTPSTLLVTKILQEATNGKMALNILSHSTTLITDIFVVVDTHTQKAYRVEKSPLKMAIHTLTVPFVVTNHLQSPLWSKDWINLKRQKELTTIQREKRGEVLLNDIEEYPKVHTANTVLTMLRDKRNIQGTQLPLGDRQAIDALIATHSVILDGENDIIYVSEGPHLIGKFWGFHLSQSFQQKKPVPTGEYLLDDSDIRKMTPPIGEEEKSDQ